MSTDWIVPDWPAPPQVRALFTTRSGGVSAAPFDSFNLGDHVRDDPVAVAANRARLAHSLAARPLFLQQVHGTAVATLAAHTQHGCTADASVSAQPGLACTVLVADCLPVLFTNCSGSVVAAAHAGWRGLAGTGPAAAGVLQTTFAAFEQMVRQTERNASVRSRAPVAGSTLVWLGPCIGPQAFEVGPEVRAAFAWQRPQASAAFVASGAGKYLANLPRLARLHLAALGVTQVYGNDGSLPWCTVAQSSRFFSHRRDALHLGSTGRMAACIWLV